ncbi:MAG: ABC transporter substrate-binding protein [Rhodospirillaceae bacterium]|nr:ABC transporter substrate-binding protein [Rhodospirillaceae bacterium]
MRILCLAICLCFGIGAAVAETALRVAVVGLPRTQGHPYAVSNLPAIYVFTAIYDALTFVDGEGRVTPWLATAWRQTSPTTWEFDLRDGVTFSNGEPFDAAAVVASVDYLTSPAARGDTSASELSSLAGARALDRLTVEIATNVPNPVLHREVSALRIIAPRHWATVGPDGYARAPVGTGPFRAERWEAARISLAAFSGSWRPPRVDRLEFRALPEMSSRVQGLLSGQIDMAFALRVDEQPLLEAAGHRLQANRGTGVFTIALNVEQDARFQDVRVRQALNLAIDRAGISRNLLAGKIAPASQFTPPNATGYDPDLKPYPYDPDRARALLAEAGYPDGFSFVFEGVMGGAVSDGALFQQIAADLAKVGVRMDIRPILLHQLSAFMHSDGGWSGSAFGTDYGTAPSLDSLRSLKLHSCLHAFKWFCDAEGLPLLQRALAAPTEAERTALTRQVFRRYYDLYPAILLWDIVYFDGIRNEVGEVPAVGTWIVYDRIEKRAE